MAPCAHPHTHTGVPRPPERCTTRCNEAPPVASQRNLLQQSATFATQRNVWHRSATCCAASQSVATQRHLCNAAQCVATKHHLLHPGAAMASCALLPFFRSMRVRSAARLGTAHTKPLLHFGLRSSLTTGLGSYPPTSAPGPSPPPTHICTGTESIPCPPLPCERVHPSARLHGDRVHAHICSPAAALRDICLCATQV